MPFSPSPHINSSLNDPLLRDELQTPTRPLAFIAPFRDTLPLALPAVPVAVHPVVGQVPRAQLAFGVGADAKLGVAREELGGVYGGRGVGWRGCEGHH